MSEGVTEPRLLITIYHKSKHINGGRIGRSLNPIGRFFFPTQSEDGLRLTVKVGLGHESEGSLFRPNPKIGS